MKTRMIVVSALMMVPLLLGACSPAKTVEVACEDFSESKHVTRQVEVKVGEVLTVSLCSNRTTGFQWSEAARISDKAALRQTGHEFIEPGEENGDGPVVGAPGEERWTFEALRKGTSEVFVEYSRPWEGGEKGEWTFTLTVLVR